MTEFLKYPKIKVLGSPENFTIFSKPGENIYVEEKMDGCFDYKMKVETENGTIEIGRIVNSKMKIKVLSYNTTTGKKEYKDIINWYHNGPADNWLKVSYMDRLGERYLNTTDNHKFFDGTNFKPINEFSVGDNIYLHEPAITNEQKDILIGGILGDGCFHNMNESRCPTYSETHGIKQEEYLKFKKEALRNVIKTQGYYTGRFGKNYPEKEKYRIGSGSYLCFKELSFMYKNGKKNISDSFLGKLNYRILAIWYCDDGSARFSDLQRPRIRLSTNGFSRYECEILIKELQRLGYSPKMFDYKGWTIQLNANDSEMIYEKIYRYIPKCMNYKLPAKYHDMEREVEYEVPNISRTIITKIEPIKPKNKQRYDIEVADNHNYFIKGVLVSNSNMRIQYNPQDKKLTFGSRNLTLGTQDEQIGGRWLKAITFVKQKFNLKENDSIPNFGFPQDKSFVLCGECIVPHTIRYDFENTPPFIGFDVYLSNEDGPHFLDYATKKNVFEFFDLPIVPLIKVCKSEEITSLDESIVPKSAYYPGLAEGVVFKNYDQQIFGKIVRQQFKEKNREVFGSPEKYANGDDEKLVAALCPNARIDKIIFKLMDEGNALDRPMMQHLPKRVWDDICEEEWKEILGSRWTINFPNVRKMVSKRCLAVLDQVVMQNVVISGEN